jgi:esterase/lipase
MKQAKLKRESDDSQRLKKAMHIAKDQPSPKLEKIKHLIPTMIESLNQIN